MYPCRICIVIMFNCHCYSHSNAQIFKYTLIYTIHTRIPSNARSANLKSSTHEPSVILYTKKWSKKSLTLILATTSLALMCQKYLMKSVFSETISIIILQERNIYYHYYITWKLQLGSQWLNLHACSEYEVCKL